MFTLARLLGTELPMRDGPAPYPALALGSDDVAASGAGLRSSIFWFLSHRTLSLGRRSLESSHPPPRKSCGPIPRVTGIAVPTKVSSAFHGMILAKKANNPTRAASQIVVAIDVF